MVTKEIQPKWQNTLIGELGVDLYDAQGDRPEFILDRAQMNAVVVTMKITGSSAWNIKNHLDQFTLRAYLEEATGAGNQVLSPITFNGNQGDLVGNTITFPPNVLNTLTTIPIPANLVPAGVYRLTVILTHSTQDTSPKIFGFVEYGMVQFV